MSIVLALDPGIRYPACALFVSGTLAAAGRVKLPGAWTKLPMAQRCLEIAKACRTWLGDKSVYDTKLDYVFEWPKVYAGKKAKGDPADLFPLTGVGMAVAGLLNDVIHELNVHSYLPREWAGNIPKSTKGNPLDSIRGQRVWGRLSDAEKAVVVLSHDALDAVGIGLKFLGRYERQMSLIGAS